MRPNNLPEIRNDNLLFLALPTYNLNHSYQKYTTYLPNSIFKKNIAKSFIPIHSYHDSLS